MCWLNQWLAMDVKCGFLRQRNKENYQLQKWTIQDDQIDCLDYKNLEHQSSIFIKIKFVKEDIWLLNSLWWDKTISLEAKKRLGKATVGSMACNGYKFWLLKTKKQRKLLALQIGKLARVSRLQKFSNNIQSNRFQTEFEESN